MSYEVINKFGMYMRPKDLGAEDDVKRDIIGFANFPFSQTSGIDDVMKVLVPSIPI